MLSNIRKFDGLGCLEQRGFASLRIGVAHEWSYAL
jgi:hypothetical protein